MAVVGAVVLVAAVVLVVMVAAVMAAMVVVVVVVVGGHWIQVNGAGNERKNTSEGRLMSMRSMDVLTYAWPLVTRDTKQ